MNMVPGIRTCHPCSCKRSLAQRIIRYYELQNAGFRAAMPGVPDQYSLMISNEHGVEMAGRVVSLSMAVIQTARWWWQGWRESSRNSCRLTSTALGWCTLIDDGLRQDVMAVNASNGVLVVAAVPLFEPNIFSALRHLREQRRIKIWNRDYDRNLGYYTVSFNHEKQAK